MNRPGYLCHVAELPEGSSRGFLPDGQQQLIFVLRVQGRVYAYQDACPHYGNTPLAWRRDAYLNADGTRIICAAHGAEFLPDTGVCVLGPCLGQALTPVALQQHEDGALTLVRPITNNE